MAKQFKNDFDSVLSDVPTRSAALPKPEKPQHINIPISKEAKKLLDRVVHHKGKKTTQKNWLQAVVEAAIAADPDSKKPVPGEE